MGELNAPVESAGGEGQPGPSAPSPSLARVGYELGSDIRPSRSDIAHPTGPPSLHAAEARASYVTNGRLEYPPRPLAGRTPSFSHSLDSPHPNPQPPFLPSNTLPMDHLPLDQRVAVLEGQRMELFAALSASQDGALELRREMEVEKGKQRALSNLLFEVYLVVQRLDPAGCEFAQSRQ